MSRLKEKYLVGDISEDGFSDSFHSGRIDPKGAEGCKSYGPQSTDNESWAELSANEEESCATPETSSERLKEPDDILRVHQLGIGANLVNTFGTGMLLGYSILNLETGRAHGNLFFADITYISYFSGFFIAGLAELVIDASFQRTFRHRWYSLHRRWNVIITCFLFVGTILDFVAFLLWRVHQMDAMNNVLYAASHVWLVMGVIVLVVSPPSFKSKIIWAGGLLDDAGNIFFVVGSLSDCIARYLHTANGGRDFDEAIMELVAAALWSVGALTYVISDHISLQTWKMDLLVLPTDRTS